MRIFVWQRKHARTFKHAAKDRAKWMDDSNEHENKEQKMELSDLKRWQTLQVNCFVCDITCLWYSKSLPFRWCLTLRLLDHIFSFVCLGKQNFHSHSIRFLIVSEGKDDAYAAVANLQKAMLRLWIVWCVEQGGPKTVLSAPVMLTWIVSELKNYWNFTKKKKKRKGFFPQCWYVLDLFSLSIGFFGGKYNQISPGCCGLIYFLWVQSSTHFVRFSLCQLVCIILIFWHDSK